MLRRTNNIDKKAYYGLSASILLDLLWFANKRYLKMDDKLGYGALALSAASLFFSAYHTPLRHLMPRYGLFRNKTTSETKTNAAAVTTDAQQKKIDTKDKTHRRRKSC